LNWWRSLLNMFNPSHQTIVTSSQCIKLFLHVGTLLSNKRRTSLDRHSLKSIGDSFPFPLSDMIRRQQKTTPKGLSLSTNN
jgi:hypothetical protein